MGPGTAFPRAVSVRAFVGLPCEWGLVTGPADTCRPLHPRHMGFSASIAGGAGVDVGT